METGTYGGSTIPLAERETRYVMTDHVGPTRLLTKARRIVVIYDGSPFGVEFAQSGDTKVSGDAVRNS
jgi:hypothetical protein